MLPATAFCKNGLPRRCIAAFGDTVAKGHGAKGILPRCTPMCPSSRLLGIYAEAAVHQTAPHGIAQCVRRKPPTVHLRHLPKGTNVKEGVDLLNKFIGKIHKHAIISFPVVLHVYRANVTSFNE